MRTQFAQAHEDRFVCVGDFVRNRRKGIAADHSYPETMDGNLGKGEVVPARTSVSTRASSTLLVIGPSVSKVGPSGATPSVGIDP